MDSQCDHRARTKIGDFRITCLDMKSQRKSWIKANRYHSPGKTCEWNNSLHGRSEANLDVRLLCLPYYASTDINDEDGKRRRHNVRVILQMWVDLASQTGFELVSPLLKELNKL